uniref:Uncharacterized protein n=1 Tax=Anopheles albimanus TaxID=7167 RepID=A0A182FIW9_ANOAL
MQLMTFNSLLMFDIVFIFFLFLVGVTCLVYYLPPRELSPVSAGEQLIITTTSGFTGCDHHQHHQHQLQPRRLDHGCLMERCGLCAVQQQQRPSVQSCAAAARRISGEGGTPILQSERPMSVGTRRNPANATDTDAFPDREQQGPTALQSCTAVCHQYQQQQQQQQQRQRRLASETDQQQQTSGQLASLQIAGPAEATEEGETVEEVLLLDYSSSFNQLLVMRHDSSISSTSSRFVLQEAAVAPSHHEQPDTYHRPQQHYHKHQPPLAPLERFVQIKVDSSSAGGANASTSAPTPCCYVRAKASDIKECHGPICDV